MSADKSKSLERTYRLDLDKEDFRRAIVQLSQRLPAHLHGRVFFTFSEGNLVLTRDFLDNPALNEDVKIQAKGWWPSKVSISWRDAYSLLPSLDVLDTFFLAFSGRVFHVGNRVVSGDGGREQLNLALDDPARRIRRPSIPAAPPPPSKRDIDALILRIAEIDAENAARPPEFWDVIAQRYERDEELVRLMKTVRGHKCQICGFSFLTKSGELYTECHHLEGLADAGLDISSNLLIVCANHHRQLHYGIVSKKKHNSELLVIEIDGKVHSIPLSLPAPSEDDDLPF